MLREKNGPLQRDVPLDAFWEITVTFTYGMLLA